LLLCLLSGSQPISESDSIMSRVPRPPGTIRTLRGGQSSIV
jgi:hypothetical protein